MFGLLRFRTLGTKILLRVNKLAAMYSSLNKSAEACDTAREYEMHIGLQNQAMGRLNEAMMLAEMAGKLAPRLADRTWFIREAEMLRLAGDGMDDRWFAFWTNAATRFTEAFKTKD